MGHPALLRPMRPKRRVSRVLHTLNIYDAIKCLEGIMIANPKKYFKKGNKPIFSTVLYYGERRLRSVGSECIGGMDGPQLARPKVQIPGDPGYIIPSSSRPPVFLLFLPFHSSHPSIYFSPPIGAIPRSHLKTSLSTLILF